MQENTEIKKIGTVSDAILLAVFSVLGFAISIFNTTAFNHYFGVTDLFLSVDRTRIFTTTFIVFALPFSGSLIFDWLVGLGVLKTDSVIRRFVLLLLSILFFVQTNIWLSTAKVYWICYFAFFSLWLMYELLWPHVKYRHEKFSDRYTQSRTDRDLEDIKSEKQKIRNKSFSYRLMNKFGIGPVVMLLSISALFSLALGWGQYLAQNQKTWFVIEDQGLSTIVLNKYNDFLIGLDFDANGFSKDKQIRLISFDSISEKNVAMKSKKIGRVYCDSQMCYSIGLDQKIK